jgi:hypothetical protein
MFASLEVGWLATRSITISGYYFVRYENVSCACLEKIGLGPRGCERTKYASARLLSCFESSFMYYVKFSLVSVRTKPEVYLTLAAVVEKSIKAQFEK